MQGIKKRGTGLWKKRRKLLEPEPVGIEPAEQFRRGITNTYLELIEVVFNKGAVLGLSENFLNIVIRKNQKN